MRAGKYNRAVATLKNRRESTVLLRCFSVLLGLAMSAIAAHPAAAWIVTPRNSLTINTTSVSGVVELSGAAYLGHVEGSTHELYAVQDSSNQFVTVSFNLAANGSLTSATATAKRSLSPGFDFEGIALGPTGSVLISEESTPTVRRYNVTTGAQIAAISLPAVFANSRSNNALESLTRVPNSDTYWTANEAALTVDGPTANTTHGTLVRLQRFDYDESGTLSIGPQFAYSVDPIHIGTTTDSNTRSGLVDLVALPDGSLLTLERSLGIPFSPLYQYENRIYRVSLAGATDVSQSPFNAGLSGQSYTPAMKTLLWKGQVGGVVGQNMEGLALGPQLSGGNWTLLGVVDNGGSGSNTLASFALAPAIAGDFNGDGSVDAADYIAWRKGFGSTFVANDFDIWRSHFGQSGGTGSFHGLPKTIGVPEPGVVCFLAAMVFLGVTTQRMSQTFLLPTFGSRLVVNLHGRQAATMTEPS